METPVNVFSGIFGSCLHNLAARFFGGAEITASLSDRIDFRTGRCV